MSFSVMPLFDSQKEALSRISQVIVFGQPSALNAIETVDSFDRPIAARFPCLCRMQDLELTICQSVQSTGLYYWRP